MLDTTHAPHRPVSLLRGLLGAAPLLLALFGGCTTIDDTPELADADADADADANTPRMAEPSEPCFQYCEARAGTFMERCSAQTDDPQHCEESWSEALERCLDIQCSLVVQVPDPSGLEQLATQFGVDLLGPQFELVGTQPHYWGPEEIGSIVYSFASQEDGAPAFIELGASLDQPPLVSYGFGPVAADAMAEHAIERLSESYGALGYSLGRRYFTASHPILEFTTPAGSSFFYSVATDDVSDAFGIEDDPDADPMELAVRDEGFVREWSRYVQ